MAELAALRIGDPPELWHDLGFVVEDGCCWVSGIRHELGGAEPGVRGWSMRGVDADALDGLALDLDTPAARPTPAHPNAVVSLDHLVVGTPDLSRTIEAIEEAGIELRRTREAGRNHQAFFKLGEVILEVVGPMRPAGSGPIRLYGLAFTVADLDATAAFLGSRLRPPKDAVQPGRRIATLDRAAGSTVPIAFMTPEPR